MLETSSLHTDRLARARQEGNTMASITFDRVTLQYPGAERPSVSDLSLHIDDGEFLVLVGPSGCGKSTTLRMLAGLEQVSEGSILIDDTDVTEKDPKDRDIAMVFQNYALYPHMTVAENMGFALKTREEAEGRDPRAGRRGSRAARPHGISRPQAEGALGRPAPARRHGSCDRALAAGVLHGRAALEPRRQAARADEVAHRRRCSGAWASQPSTSRTTRSRR